MYYEYHNYLSIVVIIDTALEEVLYTDTYLLDFFQKSNKSTLEVSSWFGITDA
ncbi:hypothetical protein [Lysinibacillus sp. CTST325]